MMIINRSFKKVSSTLYLKLYNFLSYKKVSALTATMLLLALTFPASAIARPVFDSYFFLNFDDPGGDDRVTYNNLSQTAVPSYTVTAGYEDTTPVSLDNQIANGA